MRTNICGRGRGGFTLVEMLVVVVLVGIMAAIMIPRLRASPRTRVRQAAVQLAADLELARARAMATTSTVRIAIDAPGDAYRGYLDHDGDGTIVGAPDETEALRAFAERRLTDGVRFGRGEVAALGAGVAGMTPPAPPEAGRIHFDSRGLPTPLGTATVVYLRHEADPSAVAAVEITPAGGIRRHLFGAEGWR